MPISKAQNSKFQTNTFTLLCQLVCDFDRHWILSGEAPELGRKQESILFIPENTSQQTENDIKTPWKILIEIHE